MDRSTSLAALGAALTLLCGVPLAALAQAPAPPAQAPVQETIRVQVLGAVAHSGEIVLRDGDRLSLALARAGTGGLANSDLSRVFLTRLKPANGKPVLSYFVIDVSTALQRGDQRYDPILHDGDRIYVPEIRVRGVRVTPPIFPTL